MGCYYATKITGPETIMTTILELTGCHAAEVAGVKVIVSTIPEPTGRRAYGMCRTFRVWAAVPPLH
jgi:hypothetical protein